MRVKKSDREEALADLRAELKPGDTVYTILRHVGSSGMTRWIDLYVIRDNRPRWLSYRAAQAGVGSWDERRDCIRVGGCGMDMGFALVYELSQTLFCTDGYTHEGAYALKHAWI